MASRSATRPHLKLLLQDRVTLQAIKDLADYTPANAALNTAMLTDAETALNAAEKRVTSLAGALAQARGELDIAAWAFHERIIAAKAQVIAQYGNDSPVVQAIGLKRRSARRRPVRRENVGD
jgi:hypothetical protein